ncbi:MAG TPA: MCE family protein [Acidimicrobiales bacterium]|nr:MCE family protein [Acidimicrobiales bacterium]
MTLFAIAFVVMVAWAVNQVVSVDQIARPYRVSAQFANAFGIVKNAEVTYLGVTYGGVTSVHLEHDGVRVDMDIERGKRIPADATAMITRKSAIGEPYIDFEPTQTDTGRGPFLRDGDLVPRSRTAVPLEFSELLRSASALVASVPPDDVGSLVHELSVGLNGRSGDLRTMADATDKLAATFASRTDTLDRLAANNTKLTHVVTEHREALGSSISDLNLLAQTLDKSKGNTSVLLERGATLLTQTGDLVAAEKGNLDCSLKDLTVVIDETSTPHRLQGLSALLTYGPPAYAGLWDSVDHEADGPWLRVGNIANTENPPAQYVPPKKLPAVNAVPACDSPLRPVALRPGPGGGVGGTGGAASAGGSSAVGAGSGRAAPPAGPGPDGVAGRHRSKTPSLGAILGATGAGAALAALLLLGGPALIRRVRRGGRQTPPKV